MNHDQSIPNASWCQHGCVVLIRWLLLHLAVGQALLSVVPTGQLTALGVYVTGWMTGTEVSATAMSAAVGVVSHDALPRLLNGTWWTARHLLLAAVKLANLVGPEGWLIVDDVVVPKLYARLIAVCSGDYEQALRRNVFGIRLVFIVWSNGWLTLPLGFYGWQKDPSRQPRKKTRRRARGRPRTRGRKMTAHTPQARQRRRRRQARQQAAQRRRPRTAPGTHSQTKNELARALGWQVVRAGSRARLLLFNHGYASRKNLGVFSRVGLGWGTSLTSHTVVLSEGQRRTVKHVAQSVPQLNSHYSAQLQVRARSFEVELAGQPVKLTVIKDDTPEEPGRTTDLATHELRLTNCEPGQGSRRRWPIAVFFRDVTQLLGLGRSQARTAQAVLTPTVLGWVSYVALPRLKPLGAQPRLSVSQSKNTLCALRLLQSVAGVTCLGWLKTAGRVEPVNIAHLWNPVRTRLSGLSLPENPSVLSVYRKPMGYA